MLTLTSEQQRLYFGDGPFVGYVYKITCIHSGELIYVGQTTDFARREKQHRSTGMLGPDREMTVFHEIHSDSIATVLTALDDMEYRVVAGEEPPLNAAPGGGQADATVGSARRSYQNWVDVYAQLVEYKRVHGHLLVPQDGGHALGNIVHHIRSNGQYTNGIRWRENALDAIGFVWSVSKHKWQVFLMCEHAYPHFNAPQKCAVYGNAVNMVRKRGDLIKGELERGLYLKSRGFKLHATSAAENEQRWTEYEATGTLDFWA